MLRVKGIVLAGGLATRLPNKPLLPMHDGRPVIASGIDFLRRNGVQAITIVKPPRSPIPHVLRMLYGTKHYAFNYVTQFEPLGVPTAIGEVDLDEHDAAVVVFCDNVYGYNSLLPNVADTVGHSVLKITNLAKARALSKWDGERFVKEAATDTCLAGFIVVDRESHAATHHFRETVSFLNYVAGRPIPWMNDGWWDVGTADAYRAYWETYR